MELKDFIVTPIILLIVYGVAFRVRPRFTDARTRRYFIPALTVRVVGSVAVGLIYQFYYGGGDTFSYHTRGSAVIWEAFADNPVYGVQLLFAGKERIPELYPYYSQMWLYGDLPSYFVVRVATVFDLFTFSTYSATAALFACLSFSGVWGLYMVFYKRFKNLHRPLAMATLFVPSVFFWGSGILKDTLTLAALGWAVYAFDDIFFTKHKIKSHILLLLASMFIIFSIKKYILMCLAPALIIWLYASNIGTIRNFVAKLLIGPVVFAVAAFLAYYAILKVGEGDSRYALDNLAETARITAYDIRYGWGARTGEGSGYTLGELDGSFASMFRLFPSAVNVSLFRPYLWEVNNPLMLLAALESLAMLLLTGYLLMKRGTGIFREINRPEVIFCLTFSIVFAFAVGVSTYNFGTLMRYKIPLMSFYASALVVLLYSNNDKKTAVEELTE